MSNSLIDREITQGVIPIGTPKAYKYDAALVEAAKASVQQGMNQLHTDGNSIISQANTILAAIRNQGGYPLKAATASAMTDTTKIYVYTGSETGYTFGDWYYYNGTAWTDGGVYNAMAFNTDPTLTVPGAAADSKVTGYLFTYQDKVYDALTNKNGNLVPYVNSNGAFRQGYYTGGESATTITSKSVPLQVGKTSMYAYMSGVDFTDYTSLNVKMYTFDNNNNIVNNLSILSPTYQSTRSFKISNTAVTAKFSIFTNDANKPINPNFLYDNNVRLYFGYKEITNDTQFDALYDVITNKISVQATDVLVNSTTILADMNDAEPNKIYNISNVLHDIANVPADIPSAIVHATAWTMCGEIERTTNWRVQFLVPGYEPTMVYVRHKSNGTWKNWQKLALNQNIIASAHNNANNYKPNDYVEYFGDIYRCIHPYTGAFNTRFLKKITVTGDLKKVWDTFYAMMYGYNVDITGTTESNVLISPISFGLFKGQAYKIKNNAAVSVQVNFKKADGSNAFTKTIASGETSTGVISGSPQYLNVYSPDDTNVNIHFEAEPLYEYTKRVAEEENSLFKKYQEQIANCACGADYYRGTGTSLTGNKNLSLMMVSDTHFDYESNKNALILSEGMDFVDAVLHLGDVSALTAIPLNGSNPFVANVITGTTITKPLFVAIGNHDEQMLNNSASYGTVEQGVSALLSHLNTASIYDERGYGYYDFDDYKVRLIILNCFDYPDTTTNGEYDYYGDRILWQQDQVDFFIDTLKSVPNGYTVVVASHYSELANVDNTIIDQHNGSAGIAGYDNTQLGTRTYMSDVVMSDIINAYKAKTAINKSYTYTNETITGNVSVNDTFASAYGDFAIWVSGHRHRACVAKSTVGDYWIYVNDTSGCGTANSSWITAYSNQPRCLGTNSRDLITVMSLDVQNKIIKFTRIGAHINRFLDDENLLTLSY